MAKESLKVLTQNIDLKELEELNNKINNNSINIEQMVDKIVDAYCSPLDKIMEKISQVLNSTIPPSDGELDEWSCKVSSVLYFTGEGVENIGIRQDISKAYLMDKYNSAYDSSTGNTISDKTADAELVSQKEQLINIIYTRAYKKAKQKLEAGTEMLNSIKKVISRRMNAYSLSVVDKGRFKE